jgi:hypothetical protein
MASPWSLPALLLLALSAPLAAAVRLRGGLGVPPQPVPDWAPPTPTWDIQPWEKPAIGGGPPPEPLVYTSTQFKFSPATAMGRYSHAADAHYFPNPSSRLLPPPNSFNLLNGKIPYGSDFPAVSPHLPQNLPSTLGAPSSLVGNPFA